MMFIMLTQYGEMVVALDIDAGIADVSNPYDPQAGAHMRFDGMSDLEIVRYLAVIGAMIEHHDAIAAKLDRLTQ